MLIDHRQPGPTSIRLRVVEGAAPVEGLTVWAVMGVSERVGEAVTDANGVAVIATTASGSLWLVANDGRGRGILLYFTAQPGGLNDAGERPLQPLDELPAIVQLKGVGYEERVSGADARPDSVAHFYVMAGGTRVLSLRGPGSVSSNIANDRVVLSDVETGNEWRVADFIEPSPPMGPQARLESLQRLDDRYAVWTSVAFPPGVGSRYTFVVYDVVERREVARVERSPVQPSAAGSDMAVAVSAGWIEQGTLTLLLVHWNRLSLPREPMVLDAVTVELATGREATSHLIPRPANGSPQFINAPSLIGDFAVVRVQRGFPYVDVIEVIDRRTLAMTSREVPGASHLVYGDAPCALLQERRATGVRTSVTHLVTGQRWQLFDGVNETARWGGIAPSGRYFFSADVDGVRQVAEGQCGAPARVSAWMGGAACRGGTFCEVHLPPRGPVWLFDSEEQSAPTYELRWQVWEWRDAAPPVLLHQSLPTLAGGAQPLLSTEQPVLVSATPDSLVAQLHFGMPGSSDHTWIRRSRRLVSEGPSGAVFYVMQDPLTDVEQVFRYRFAGEVAP